MPSTAKSDYYELLGVARDAESDEIRKAYRKLAREHHPDLRPGDKPAEERFKEVQEAYGILSDNNKRKVYDQFGVSSKTTASNAERATPDAPANTKDDHSRCSFHEIFSQFSGRGGAGKLVKPRGDTESERQTDQPPQGPVEVALRSLAGAAPEEFRVAFQRLRQQFPEGLIEACLSHIASQPLDSSCRNIAFWLTNGDKYLPVLLDSQALPVEVASKALRGLKDADPEFLLKFLKALDQLTAQRPILRALSLIPSLGDYGILLSWLRKLSKYDAERVRSRAVKLLCEIRPNKPLIERQMASNDPRVRASAIEALWHLNSPEAKELLRVASGDSNHRVVANALIGLHLQGDSSAFTRMLELCADPSSSVRATMAWCLGFVQDKRAIPALHRLSRDPAISVRKRAERILRSIEGVPPALGNQEQVSIETLAPIGG